MADTTTPPATDATPEVRGVRRVVTGIVTRANLQSGIEYALSKQGLAIRPK